MLDIDKHSLKAVIGSVVKESLVVIPPFVCELTIRHECAVLTWIIVVLTVCVGCGGGVAILQNDHLALSRALARPLSWLLVGGGLALWVGLLGRLGRGFETLSLPVGWPRAGASVGLGGRGGVGSGFILVAGLFLVVCDLHCGL